MEDRTPLDDAYEQCKADRDDAEQQLADLLVEVARLRTELEVGGPDDPRLRIERLVDEVHRLRTEVARLEAENDYQRDVLRRAVQPAPVTPAAPDAERVREVKQHATALLQSGGSKWVREKAAAILDALNGGRDG